MAALTDHVTRIIKGGTEEFLAEMPVAASQTIYNGALVSIDADGYIIPAADTASTLFTGFVHEGVDNSSGADGDETVKVYLATVRVTTGTTAATDLGVLVHVSDDDTLDLLAGVTNNIQAGVIVDRISATESYVKLVPTNLVP